MASIEVVGVHPVEALEPVHLVEVLLRENTGPLDLAGFVQRVEGQPPANWQTAYDERLLAEDDARESWRLWTDQIPAGAWLGDVRLAFFVHYLDLDVPLTTPFGDVVLPQLSLLPERLAAIRYEAP